MNNKYKILLVEDEHNISTLIMTMLESSGYQVIQAGTCALAKTLFVSHCPDLVLLDLGLPDMDGMTFLEDVRKDSLTPIIVLSARTNEKDKVLALDAGGKFMVQDLEILYDARQVFIKGKEIKLTQTEYNIVALLSEHCGKMMTYSAIIKDVWGYPDEGSVKKLQVNMANIRKKFGVKPGEATYITNELGVGYRMNSD